MKESSDFFSVISGYTCSKPSVAGSPTKVFKIQSVVLKKEGFTEIAPTRESIGSLIKELVADKTI
jgi:hypothetical protein